MIPTIIFFLLRRLKIIPPHTADKIILLFRKPARVIALLVLLLTLTRGVSAQESRLQYIIKRKGSEVGTMTVVRNTLGERTTYFLQSEVKTRFVFLITATGQEEAVFEKGVLVSSRIYRKMNGSEKANKKMTRSGANYVVTRDNKSEVLGNAPIWYTMLNLYDHEPENIAAVYSDNFQKVLPITVIAPHHYKIKFPDGNYSEYFYHRGICTSILLHHSLYTASFELKR